MAFQYVQGSTPLRGLQYKQRDEQPAQQQPSIDPGMAMNIAGQFMGGGEAAAGAEAIPAAGSGGGAGGGSAVASAGPWAALAAIIAINEYNAVGGGYRSEDKMQYTQDLFSGEVLGQDLEKRWLPKLGLGEGSKENKWISHLIHPVSADIGESWESFKDLF